jgi:predicted GNAT family N-acyltransferase
MKLIKAVIEFATPEYHESIDLRTDILRTPLGLEFTAEQLSEEYDSYHLGIYNISMELLGCLVLKPIDHETIKMRQVAVNLSLQGKGIGTALVEFSEAFSKNNKFKNIELNARDVAIPFYTKMNYSTVGEEFEEVGIPHFKMIKQL